MSLLFSAFSEAALYTTAFVTTRLDKEAAGRDMAMGLSSRLRLPFQA